MAQTAFTQNRIKLLPDETTMLNAILRDTLQYALEKDEEKRATVFSNLEFNLTKTELDIQQTFLSMQVSQEEMETCQGTMDELDAQIKSAQDEIVALQKQLRYEQAVKANKQEYDLLAKVAQEYPARSKTQQQIETANEQMKALSDHKAKLAARMELLKKQFGLLLHTAKDLRAMFDDQGMDASADL
eukprot:m.13545 g.13545  ORF g.13545 m.13545 type:complete len:187 (-) comp5955_c0_seq1:272-832(-)